MAIQENNINLILKNIGERLQVLREAHFHFSLDDIAFKAGMTSSEYIAYENGKKDITLKGVLDILDVFSVEPADFFSDFLTSQIDD